MGINIKLPSRGNCPLKAASLVCRPVSLCCACMRIHARTHARTLARTFRCVIMSELCHPADLRQLQRLCCGVNNSLLLTTRQMSANVGGQVVMVISVRSFRKCGRDNIGWSVLGGRI